MRPIVDGLFSNWVAKDVRQGDVISVMPPDGRFVIKRPQAIHRVAFAAGSGITPILSIIATTLEEQANAKFTLIYGNRRGLACSRLRRRALRVKALTVDTFLRQAAVD